MPHMLLDVANRLAKLEQKTKQLSAQLKDEKLVAENRTTALKATIATVNQTVARTHDIQTKHHQEHHTELAATITKLERSTTQTNKILEALPPRVARLERSTTQTNKILEALPPRVQAKALDEVRGSLRGIKKTQEQLAQTLDDLRVTLRRLGKHQATDRTHRNDLDKRNAKWTKLIRGQVSAVVRRLYMPQEVFADLRTINVNRFQLHSQHEEDGILTTLFQRAGVTSQRFIEIGCGRSGGNAAMFVKELGWTGLMLDASELSIKRQRSLYGHRPGMVSICAKAMPETINDILAEHGFDEEVDLFSLDIDSYEYWILDSLKVCRPRVLVIEYNALFGPERAVTVPYKEFPPDAPRLYRGASLAALEKSARRKGYRLILCEIEGCNAFFLRDDVIPELPGLTPTEAFRPALVRQSIGERIVGEDVDFFQVLKEKELPLVEV